jgi:hypothetical protein
MEIVIPTRGRIFQETYSELPKSIQKRVKFIVTPGLEQCVVGPDVIPVPESVKGIGPKRQWIIDNFGPKVLMLDDDLTFATRRQDDPTKFVPSSERELEQMVEWLDACLDSYPHVGVSVREGGNRNTELHLWNGRMLRVHGFRTDVLKKENIRFDRLPFMSDFDVTLQILRAGYVNLKINWMVQNQRSSNAPGGCSTYRTIEGLRESAHKLKALHPDYVTLVEKQTKGAWNGQARTDVSIQWKKAYQQSGKVPVLDSGTKSSDAEEGSGSAEALE